MNGLLDEKRVLVLAVKKIITVKKIVTATVTTVITIMKIYSLEIPSPPYGNIGGYYGTFIWRNTSSITSSTFTFSASAS